MTQDVQTLALCTHECLVKSKIINEDLNKLSKQKFNKVALKSFVSTNCCLN